MTISDKSWKKYIDDLRKISDKAAELMTRYLETHDYSSKEGRQEAIEYGYALAVKYGEGAAEKACQMYDAVSSTAKKRIPAAEPAETATIAEVGKAINGTLKFSQRPDVVGQSIGRLVKRTGVDTTMKNALRDGAEWAWIPNGDTCAFCLTLASRGWQRASKKAIKNGHAEHIHANCDCTYAIRFDGKSNVEGYDPDALLEMYNSAEGYGSKDKINYMRRVKYAENKDVINTQKRAAYVERKDFRTIEKNINNGIIFGDKVRQGVGAKSKTYPDVYHPYTGEKLEFVVGSRPIIPPDHTMAGRKCKTGRKIDDTGLPGRWYMDEDTLPQWQKEKAIYEVYDEYGEIRQVELHWYQHPDVGKVEYKVKTKNGYVYIDEWY